MLNAQIVRPNNINTISQYEYKQMLWWTKQSWPDARWLTHTWFTVCVHWKVFNWIKHCVSVHITVHTHWYNLSWDLPFIHEQLHTLTMMIELLVFNCFSTTVFTCFHAATTPFARPCLWLRQMILFIASLTLSFQGYSIWKCCKINELHTLSTVITYL